MRRPSSCQQQQQQRRQRRKRQQNHHGYYYSRCYENDTIKNKKQQCSYVYSPLIRLSFLRRIFLLFLVLQQLSTTTIVATTTAESSIRSIGSSINPQKEKICIIGSGNWGTAISTIIGYNVKNNPKVSKYYDETVNMWIYDEDVEYVINEEGNEGDFLIKDKLSNIINNRHENIKYLPNIKIPTNIVAIPNLNDALHGCTLLIFVLPHQFLLPLLPQIRQNIINSGICYKGISLIKGLGDYDDTTTRRRPKLISQLISEYLSNDDQNENKRKFHVGVLMGANVANEVVNDNMLSESTLACNFPDYSDSEELLSEEEDNHIDTNEIIRLLFHSPEKKFHVQHTKDIISCELLGSLKNIIALGSGFVDALYNSESDNNENSNNNVNVFSGSNTKAALIRIGLLEMKRFIKMYYSNDDDKNSKFITDNTLLESCGIADLITTCYNGRNRKCAEIFALKRLQEEKQKQQKQEQEGECLDTSKSTCNDNNAQQQKQEEEETMKKSMMLWNEIELNILNGQKLQGVQTTKDIYETIINDQVQVEEEKEEKEDFQINQNQKTKLFPLISTIYKISFHGYPIQSILTDGIIDIRYN